MNDKITAVITTISTNYIEKQLESVCNQLRDVIVCCDRDIPEMSDITLRFNCTLIYTNGVGQGRAREIGVSQVKTEYVHVIDDDDWILPQFYPDVDSADVWFTNSIHVLDRYGLTKHFGNTSLVNVSAHIVKTEIMKSCLAKYRDFDNVAEDHFYYDYFSNFNIEQYDGVLLRILIKPRQYPKINNIAQKKAMQSIVDNPCCSNNDNYTEILKEYQLANRYGLCTLFSA